MPINNRRIDLFNSEVWMNFSKMHGLGNDVVIVDAVTQNIHLSSEMIKRLANRYTGIGFEQLLIVEAPYSPNVDFHCRIFNANGSEVDQSSHGARCFARFVRLKGLTKKNVLQVSTQKGVMVLTINPDETVSVNMNEPDFEPARIPFKAVKPEKTYIIRAEDQTVLCGVVSIGNPHCIIQVDDMATAKIEQLGVILENHERFPEKAHIGFMQIIDRNNIKLSTFKRSSSESSSCAAVAIGINQGLLDHRVNVTLPDGKFFIEWKGAGFPMIITAPAIHVYDGFIAL